MQAALLGAVRQLRELSYQPELADWYVAWAEITVRMSPIVADSFAEMRARSRLGIAIAAMMPMIATTISSSIRVKPFCLFIGSTFLSKRQDHWLAGRVATLGPHPGRL